MINMFSIVQSISHDPQIKGIVISIRNDKALIKSENDDEIKYILHPINDLDSIVSIEKGRVSYAIEQLNKIDEEELNNNNFDLDLSLHLHYDSDEEFDHIGNHSITFGIKKSGFTLCKDIKLDYVSTSNCKYIHNEITKTLNRQYPNRSIRSNVYTHYN